MSTKDIVCKVDGLFVGKIQNLWQDRPPSAIHKLPAPDRQDIQKLGFVSDAQADPEHHGGVDKAIHHYAAEHYASWIDEGQIPDGTTPAAFGENVSTTGLSEWDVCIGDILRLGTAVVQISQGRQPCWKVSEYTQNRKMAYLFQKTSRTGWYYRVLEEGHVSIGDDISMIERPQPDWTVARLTAARLFRKATRAEAEELAQMPELADGWKRAFKRMAAGEYDEDVQRRLKG